VRRLSTFEGHIYASPTYIARRGLPRSPHDLNSHEWVVFRSMSGPIRLEGPGEPVTVQPRGRIVADDFLFVREAVRAGAGIGLMDSLFAARDVAEGRLVTLVPRHRMTAGGLYLVYPTTRHVPPKVAAFRDWLVEVVKGRSLEPAAGLSAPITHSGGTRSPVSK
jgi:DNA-binding transcriptional LysR family regulator